MDEQNNLEPEIPEWIKKIGKIKEESKEKTKIKENYND